MSNLESDSDSDSDYAPEADGNDEEEREVGVTVITHSIILSSPSRWCHLALYCQVEQRVSGIPVSRKRKAASLFEDMVAEENQAIEAKMLSTLNHQRQQVKSSKAKGKKREKLLDVRND